MLMVKFDFHNKSKTLCQPRIEGWLERAITNLHILNIICIAYCGCCSRFN